MKIRETLQIPILALGLTVINKKHIPRYANYILEFAHCFVIQYLMVVEPFSQCSNLRTHAVLYTQPFAIQTVHNHSFEQGNFQVVFLGQFIDCCFRA